MKNKPKRFPVDTTAGEVMVTMEWPSRAAAWYFRAWINGKRIYKTTKIADLADAMEFARQHVKDVVLSDKSVSDLTFPQMVAQYLAEQKSLDAKRTHTERARYLANFLKMSGEGIPFNEETVTSLVERFIKPAKDAYTYRKMRIVVSGFMSWLMRLRDESGRRIPWRVNPAAAHFFERRKIPRAERPIITAEEMDRLLEATRPTTIYPAIILMLSGLRPSSLNRVTWNDVHFDDKPRVSTFEKGHPRIQSLGPWAVAELKAWKKKHPDDRLTSGKENCTRMLRMVRQLTGLPDHINLAALRRATAFKLYEQGVLPGQAAKIMGHSIPTADRHYVDYKTLDADAGVNKLRFGSKKPTKSPTKIR